MVGLVANDLGYDRVAEEVADRVKDDACSLA
jgi:hypothetical protein